MPLPASIATALAAVKANLKATTKANIRDQVTLNSVTRGVIANADDQGLDYADQVVATLFDSNGLLRAELLPTSTATPTTGTTTPAVSQAAYPTATYATASYS